MIWAIMLLLFLFLLCICLPLFHSTFTSSIHCCWNLISKYFTIYKSFDVYTMTGI
jgi:hypothetical protein